MTRFATAIACCAVLAACAGKPLKSPEDYPTLTVMSDEPSTLLFTDPGMDLGRFTKVYVAPVEIQRRNDTGTSSVTSEEALKIAAYTEKAMKDALARSMTIAPAPAADVLTLRFRIVDLEPTSAAQIAMMVPPFAMVNMMSPQGAFMGSVTFGGQFYEGLAKAPSAAFLSYRSRPGADAASAFGRWTAVETILDNGAERLATDLEKLRAQKPK